LQYFFVFQTYFDTMVFPNFSDGHDPNEPIVAAPVNLHKRMENVGKGEGQRRYDQKKSFSTCYWNAIAQTNALIIRATYSPALYGQYVLDYKSGRVPDDLFEWRRAEPVRAERGTHNETIAQATFKAARKHLFPANWTVDTPGYQTLLERCPQNAVEMELMLEHVANAAEEPRRPNGNRVVRLAPLFEVPCVISQAVRDGFRRKGHAVVRERTIEKLLANSSLSVVIGELGPLIRPVRNLPRVVWTQDMSDFLALNGVPLPPGFAVGHEVPEQGGEWNDLLCDRLNFPGGAAELQRLDVLLAARANLMFELRCKADVQLTFAAAERFDASPSVQAAMEFLIQRSHTIREYRFTVDQWDSLASSVAYQCVGGLAGWVAGFEQGGAAGLGDGLVRPVAAVPVGLIQGPGAIPEGWLNLEDENRRIRLMEYLVERHVAAAPANNGRRRGAPPANDGGNGNRRVRRIRGG
jgi:hypothetical protein